MIYQKILLYNALFLYLQGGYCIESLTEGVALTLKTLLGDSPPRLIEELEEPSRRLAEMLSHSLF